MIQAFRTFELAKDAPPNEEPVVRSRFQVVGYGFSGEPPKRVIVVVIICCRRIIFGS